MWILMVTFLAYGDPALGRFLPTVNSVEFSSKATCEAAARQYSALMTPTIEQFNASIAHELNAGELRGPNGVILSTLCVPK
jgi:hypothetical protein